MQKLPLWQWFCLAIMAVLAVLSMLHCFRGDLLFHADIARDFLVIDEMVTERKPTLIGPKSGAIGGVFHGPAWYYLNLPVFIIGGGSPVLSGIFWIGLYFLAIGFFYYLTKKIFNQHIALLSTAAFMSITIFYAKGLMQCGPTMFLTLPCCYFIYQYTQTKKCRFLLAGIFTLGLMIQFQMAFGGPVLLAVGAYLLFYIIKNRLYKHLWCFLIIALPLSTFILFDLRHDFLQTKSVISYLNATSHTPIDQSLIRYFIWQRILPIGDCFAFLSTPNLIVNRLSGWISFMICIFLFIKRKRFSEKQFFMISGLMIFGFWIITLPFQNLQMRDYYYEAMRPLLILWLIYFVWHYLPKKARLLVIGTVLVINTGFGIWSGIDYLKSETTASGDHWRFYRRMAEDVLADSKGESFAYYAWTSDQLGYPSKYAIRYLSKKNQVEVFPYQKKPLTYLLVSRNDAAYNPDSNPDYWQKEQVKIEREPDEWWQYKSEFKVKKYRLSPEEITINDDQNLIDGLFFR